MLLVRSITRIDLSYNKLGSGDIHADVQQGLRQLPLVPPPPAPPPPKPVAEKGKKGKKGKGGRSPPRSKSPKGKKGKDKPPKVSTMVIRKVADVGASGGSRGQVEVTTAGLPSFPDHLRHAREGPKALVLVPRSPS